MGTINVEAEGRVEVTCKYLSDAEVGELNSNAIGAMKLRKALLVLCLALVFVPSEAGAVNAQRTKQKDLIIRDPVFKLFEHVPSTKHLLNDHKRTIYTVHGYQKLL